MKTLSRTCAVAGCAALLTGFAGITAAHAATITVPATGTLLVGGAGASVSVTFDCEAGRTADVFVDVAQKVDDQHAATGTGFTDTVMTCVEGEETAEVVVLVTGDYLFTEGDALVKITLLACDPATCEITTTTGATRFART
jgi:hypothetical protein